jgi:ABC-type multidrug transport system ATPase subunit
MNTWAPYGPDEVQGGRTASRTPRRPYTPLLPAQAPANNSAPAFGASAGPAGGHSIPAPPEDLYTTFLGGQDGYGAVSVVLDEPSHGVEIAFKNVWVVVKRNCFVENILRQKSRVYVQSATGLFPPGRMHGIISVGEEPASELADALSGRVVPADGSIWADGLPVQVALYRESVGVVKRLSWAVPEFKVEDNLHFAGSMRRGAQTAAARQRRVEVLATVLGLDLRVKVNQLGRSAQRRVDVAMEMMSSPPMLVVHNPLWGLDCHGRAEIMVALDRVASTFGTTVVVTLPTLELVAYDRLDSIVILGADGHTVFSGPKATLGPYFVSRVQNPLHQVARAPIDPADSYDISPVHDAMCNTSGTAPAPLTRPPLMPSETRPLLREASFVSQVARQRSGLSQPDLASSAVPGNLHLAVVRRSRVASTPTHPDYATTANSDAPLMYSPLSMPRQGSLTLPPLGGPDQAATQMEHEPTNETFAHRVSHRGEYREEGDHDMMEDSTGTAPDLDGGEGAMDFVHLWAAAGATDRYAAAFFDSPLHAQLVARIENAVAVARSSRSTARWISHPLIQPNVFTKLAYLTLANVRQRAKTLDWYVGWAILSLAVIGCVWLAAIQHETQQGMFNIRGIVFFMFAVTLQLNETLIRSYCGEIDRFEHLKASGVAPTFVQLTVIEIMMLLTRIVYLAPTAIGLAIVLDKDSSSIAVLLGMMSWAHICIVFVVLLFVRNVRYALTTVASVDMVMLFFSGFLVNVKDPPAEQFSGLSLVRYGYGAALHFYLRQYNYSCDGNNFTSYCYTADGYLEAEGFENDTAHGGVVTLAAIACIAILIASVRMLYM